MGSNQIYSDGVLVYSLHFNNWKCGCIAGNSGASGAGLCLEHASLSGDK